MPKNKVPGKEMPAHKMRGALLGPRKPSHGIRQEPNKSEPNLSKLGK